MDLRKGLEALQIATIVGVTIGLMLDIAVKHELSVVSIVVHTFCTYMMFRNNEMFWELVEKYKRR